MNIDKLKRDFKRKFRKKPLSEKILDIRAQFLLFKRDLDAQIARDVFIAKQARANGVPNERAEARIKNAYYTRLLVAQAEADLDEVITDAQLNRVINNAGKAIARLNNMANFSPKIHMGFMNWQIDTLNERMTKKPELIKQPEMEGSVSLPDSIIDRLLAGELISDCIAHDRVVIENSGVSEQNYEDKSDTDKKYEENLAQMMKEIDDLP